MLDLSEGVDSQSFGVGWHSLALGTDASSGASAGAKGTIGILGSKSRGYGF